MEFLNCRTIFVIRETHIRTGESYNTIAVDNEAEAQRIVNFNNWCDPLYRQTVEPIILFSEAKDEDSDD